MTRFKFQGCHRYALAYGPMLAEAIRTYLPGSYDCITWTPVSAVRRRERGYDQAQLLAQATAEALGKQALPLLTKVKDTKAQSALTDGRLRKSNVAGVYSVPRPHEVAGKKILVIDDILTTGATLEEAAQTLRAAGAAQVVAAAFCRTPKT